MSIKSLHIKNYALIRELDMQFDSGLTIITGETGAGKSILLGALGLIMGERADTKALYNFNKKCVVRAVFDISTYELQEFFEENELDYEEELVIQRELTPSGKSRAYVNDTPVRLPLLRRLSSSLIDLHRQFDTLDINETSFQIKLLDALAGQQEEIKTYRREFKEYHQKLRALEQLREQAQQNKMEREFLQFYLDELLEAELKAGEQEELEELQKKLSHAEEIQQKLHHTHFQLLDSESALLPQLDQLLIELNKLKDYMPALSETLRRFDELSIEMRELAGELPRLSEEAQANPEKLEEVNQRLDQLYRLQQKHQLPSTEKLLEKQRQLEEKLAAGTQTEQEIRRLEKETEQAYKNLTQKAQKISKKRRSVAPQFRKKVIAMLQELGMPSARLDITFELLRELSPHGLDEVQFLFSANKGAPLQPIKEVASGGELARLTLTTKSLVASAIPLPTLIFDEIDTGISGDVALKMGNILAQLAKEHQVICITHSPQVAARAHKHYEVIKEETKDSTQTQVHLLQKEDRVHAIAVMLSKNPPTEAAVENARELMGEL